MTAIKGILFDKDGTLIDFHATWAQVAEEMALEAAKGNQDKADTMLIAGGLDPVTRSFMADSIFAAGTNLDIIELWFPELSRAEQLETLEEFNQMTADKGAVFAVALPGIIDALNRLHTQRFRLGVATNDSTLGCEKTLAALGIAQLFEAAYGYDAVANAKPAPDTVRAFCDLTGLKPAEIAMIGDNRHDLDMARAGGCGLAIGVLSGTGTRASLSPLADVVLESVADLPGYLMTLRQELDRKQLS
ncbi:HAD family hydrolase [Aquamicrobium segne]|uniref:phosphoglycolate phosphatase n=1 Tax=Aquamicrobium segne TaxID=469547 RepID=A0ABW0GUC2_9HYPH